jgi:hypothetical protein
MPAKGARLSGQPGHCIPRDEIARRLAFVEDALAAMLPTDRVKREFRREFGVGERCAEKYLRRVLDRWEAEGKAAVDRDAKRVEIEQGLNLTVRRALAGPRPDARAAVNALQLKAKLHGLAHDRLEHSGPAGGPIPHHHHDVDAGHLSERIGALARALGGAGGPAGPGAPAGAGADDAGGAAGPGPAGGAGGG